MSEIKLTVPDENVETLILILNNLKSGLISHIDTSKSRTRQTQYKPKNDGVIYEHESGTNDTSGKYSASAYKERLKKRMKR